MGGRRAWRTATAGCLVVAVLGLVVVLRATVLGAATVAGDSMEPTFHDGDVVLVQVVRGGTAVARGDVVVLRDAEGASSLKRVVGLTGDSVALLDGVLEVDGEPVDEPYLHPRLLDGVYFGPVVVPGDSVFVLGDNRTASVDSRTQGAVRLDDVVGRVLVRTWPLR